MEQYKREFIEFMVRSGVLMFGEFVTKSGRTTPYFINTGNYTTGAQMVRLGEYYAAAIMEKFGRGFDVLFGPAYKGIPLVIAAAAAFHRGRGMEVPFCFNRKEAKDHGEKGRLIGHALKDGDRVLIVEDVVTAGTSIRETVPLVRAAAGVELAGLIVSVDRMERGAGTESALDEIRRQWGMPVSSIVTIDEIVSHLHNRELDGGIVLDDTVKKAMDSYRNEYGARQ